MSDLEILQSRRSLVVVTTQNGQKSNVINNNIRCSRYSGTSDERIIENYFKHISKMIQMFML